MQTDFTPLLDFISSLFASLFGFGWVQPVLEFFSSVFVTTMALAFVSTILMCGPDLTAVCGGA